MSVAKKGDFVVIEKVSRITTLSPRTAEPIYTSCWCGIVASADRDGVVKTIRVNGAGKPIKIHDIHGFKFAHIVSAARLNVAEAVEVCASRSFTNVDEVREAVRPFLKVTAS